MALSVKFGAVAWLLFIFPAGVATTSAARRPSHNLLRRAAAHDVQLVGVASLKDPEVSAKSAHGAGGVPDHTEMFAALQFAAEHPEELAANLAADDIEALSLAVHAAYRVSQRAKDPSGEAPATDAPADPAPAKPDGGIAAFFGIDIERLSTKELGNLPWFLAGASVLTFGIFEVIHRKWADTDLSVSPESKDKHEGQLLRMFVGIWPLVRPYLCQRSSHSSWFYFGTLIFLGFCELALTLTFMFWKKDFWDTIENKKMEHFAHVMTVFTLLVFTAIMVTTYLSYISMMLVINWRRFMTDWLLNRWLTGKVFYQLQLNPGDVPDNPDQRIQEDVGIFIEHFMALAGGLLVSSGRLIVMLPMLLVLSPDYAFGVFYCPGWLLYIALIYSGLGAVVAHWVGQQLIVLNYAKQRYEADFRYQIVQIRDNAESISLWGSEKCEKDRLDTSFEWIVRVWWMLMLYTKRLGFFTSFYMQTSVTFPYLVLAPNYFQGQITLGTLFMLFSVLAAVKGSFDWFINSYPLLTSFRATVDRLSNFIRAIEESSAAQCAVRRLDQPPPGPPLVAAVRDLSVSLPGKAGRSLWESAELSVAPGEFVLLSAPEGSGKSCFLRAVAGIWPKASGEVFLPEGVLFVPQRSYIPQGRLKQAVAYPENESAFSDEEVRASLDSVGLTVLQSRSLSEDANWSMILSGGEQQRLAMARVLLRKPAMLLMDEATSALGEAGTLEVYELLRRPGNLPAGAAVVSVSHEVQLLSPVHDKHYTYEPSKGVWILV